jgi:peptidoglycan/LPS O-acetylase OafA/YrhL
LYRSIQGCRAIAAFLVVLHHLGTAVSSPKYFGASAFALPFSFGDSGVVFFFVLSGFIITWAHVADFSKPPRVLAYLRKRAVRIYPSYLIVFAAVYLLALAVPATRHAVPHDFATLLKTLALIPQDPAVVGGSGAPVLVVAWSLQYEICFYTLFAFFILNRYLGAAVLLGLLANASLCHFDSCGFPRIFFANYFFVLFGVGVIVALAGRCSFRLSRPVSLAILSAFGFLAFALLETTYGQDSIATDRRLIYGSFSALLIYALIQAEDSGHLNVRNRWIPLLGDSSYVLYLIHFPGVSILCKLLVFLGARGAAGALLAFPLIFFICVGLAVVFHVFVEKPLLRLLSNKQKVRSVPVLPETGSGAAIPPHDGPQAAT